MTAAALEAQIAEKRREVAREKHAIRQHKTRLHEVATELAELEAHARRLGLGLYTQPGALKA